MNPHSGRSPCTAWIAAVTQTRISRMPQARLQAVPTKRKLWLIAWPSSTLGIGCLPLSSR